MQIWSSFDKLPEENKYMFRKLFSNKEYDLMLVASWFVTDIYTTKDLEKLAKSMDDYRYEITNHPDSPSTFYMVVY